MFESGTTARARFVALTMVTVYTLMDILHVLFGGVWAGWTVFMAALVVRAARAGRLDAETLR